MKTQTFRRFATPAILVAAALSAVADATQVPTPPTPVFHSRVAQCQSNIPGNTSNTHSDPHQVVYGPQAGWVIFDYSAYDMGSYGNETENWSSAPAGSFVSSSDFQTAYSAAYAAVVSANIPSVIQADINASLTTSYSVNSAYAMSLASSFGNITLSTNATGQNHGFSQFQAGSAATLDLDVWLLQVVPCMAGGPQFRNFLLSWTTNAIAAAKAKIARQEWLQLLASSYNHQLVGLAQMAIHSPTKVDPTLQRLVAITAETMGWPNIDIAADAKKLPIPPMDKAAYGQRRVQCVAIPNMTKDQVIADIKSGLATAGVGRG
jgi:hypothetical protein